MTDIAERLVAEWVDEHVNTPPIRKVKPDMVEHLTCHLIAAAWEAGLTRKQFLDAVDGDAYEFVLYEFEKASARSNSARRSPAWRFLGATCFNRPSTNSGSFASAASCACSPRL